MKWIYGFLLLCAYIAAQAWMFMLFVGVVHGEWIPQLPTIGFDGSITLVGCAVIALGFARPMTTVLMELIMDKDGKR